LPAPMRKVVVENHSFTDYPPLPVQDYLTWTLKADRAYQIAVRWILLEPYMFQLKARRVDDIREYYFLSNDPELNYNLNQFNSLAPEIKDLYAERLIGVCYNSERTTESCRRKLHESAKEN